MICQGYGMIKATRRYFTLCNGMRTQSERKKRRENDKWHSFNTTRAGKATNDIEFCCHWTCYQCHQHNHRNCVSLMLSCSPPPTPPHRLSTDVLLRFYFFLSTPLRLPRTATTSLHMKCHFCLFFRRSLSPTLAYARRELSLFALCVCMFYSGIKEKLIKL